MNYKKLYGVIVFAGLVGSVEGEDSKEPSRDSVRSKEDYISSVFENSSILVSSRWKRPRALLLAKNLGATHLVWGYYSAESEFIKNAKSIGLKVHCALPYFLPSKFSEKQKSELQCGRLDGSPVRGRWEVGWDMRRGDANKTSFRKYQLERIKSLIDIGCDHFQHDASRMNGVAVEWGGCFSSEGDKKFRTFLLDKYGGDGFPDFSYINFLEASRAPDFYGSNKWKDPFKNDYVEFQKNETLEYFSWLHREVEKYAGRPIFFSMNTNPHDSTAWLSTAYDGAMSEIHKNEVDPSYLIGLIGKLKAKNKPVVLTLASEDIDLNSKAIASSYALGALMIYPWDVYISNKNERYFGDLSDYKSLYGFVKKYSQIFDGYKSHKEYVLNLKMDDTERLVNERPVTIRKIQKPSQNISRQEQREFKVLVSIRKSKDGTDSLVHLVNWGALGETEQRYIVSFKKSLFRNVLEYLYDSSLKEVRKLNARNIGDRIEIEVDRLNLWSVFASVKAINASSIAVN